VRAELQSNGLYLLSINDFYGHIEPQIIDSSPLSRCAAITLFGPHSAKYLTAKAIQNLVEWEWEWEWGKTRPDSKRYCLLDDDQILHKESGEFYLWEGEEHRLTRLIPEGFRIEEVGNKQDREGLKALEESKEEETINFDEILAELGLSHQDLEKSRIKDESD